ncbi:MAG: hypothetical protein JSS32_08255 [Verrucomicrobia bacterium]|nr:hypothetical protein [Verrucomicrobiota bacterium]
MVVNSEAYRTFLAKQSPRKGLVIDMESFGFFKVIDDLLRQSDSVSQGIMIRGISDYAGRKETTELGKTAWKTVAVRNAAKVAASAIKQLAEIS